MDLGVRPQRQMLWGEDLGPETDVDHPELPRESGPEISQGDVIDGSSDSEEDEWKYVKGAVKAEDKKTLCQDDGKSQLNPNAMEFVPGFPSVDKDEFIAASPNVNKTASKNLDDIDVPSEVEFERDISFRACDLEAATNNDVLDSIVGVSRSEEVDSHPLNENKSDGISLILTPQDKIEMKDSQETSTNPFAFEMQSQPVQSDQVDFVQDYFGKGELDFKPFESDTSRNITSEKQFIAETSSMPLNPNPVSVELSSDINLTDSNLGCSDKRPDESEKERNQLEIKEPESPVNSEGYSNGLVKSTDIKIPEKGICSDQGSVQEIDSVKTLESDSDIFCKDFDIKTVEKNVTELNDYLVDSKISENIKLEKTGLFDTKEEYNKVVEEEQMIKVEELDHKFDAKIEANQEINERSDTKTEIENSHEDLMNNFVDKVQVAFETEDLGKDGVSESNEPVLELESTGDVFTAVSVDDNDNTNNHVDLEVNQPLEFSDNVIELGDVINVHVENLLSVTDEGKTPAEDELSNISQAGTPFSEEKENMGVSDETTEHCIESQMELADTIGPNAFSFSQPYEHEIHSKITSIGFMGLRKNDIMTTSMHETLVQDSSLGFINDGVVQESIISRTVDGINSTSNTFFEGDNIGSSFTNDNVETCVEKLENGVDIFELKLDELSNVTKDNGNNGFAPVESAIVESHEVPVSCEPDLVFVEKICPTVEVRSDEASPVSKENTSIDLMTGVSVASVATALGVVAAISSLSDQKEPDLIEKDVKEPEEKATAKPAASKGPVSKRPTSSSAGTKAPVTKAATAKAAPTKTNVAPSKPKAPTATRPTPPLTKAKSVPSTARTTTSALTRTTSAAKPPVKSTATSLSRATSKPAGTSAPKVPLGGAKAPPKLSSTTAKPALNLSGKPAAPSKTLSSAPRVPLAAKKPSVPAPTKTVGMRPASATDNKITAKSSLKSTTAASTKPSAPKTTSMVGAKPPSKLSLTAPANKLKATSPTKPAPIKAKAPLTAPKRPSSATNKKPSTILDKNAKNAVKSVPKETAQKEIITSKNQLSEESVSSTTNGYHIENGNVTTLEEVPSHII